MGGGRGCIGNASLMLVLECGDILSERVELYAGLPCVMKSRSENEELSLKSVQE
jgi:hypothetical protein